MDKTWKKIQAKSKVIMYFIDEMVRKKVEKIFNSNTNPNEPDIYVDCG